MGSRHDGETAQEKETRRLRLLKEGEWACTDPKCAHVNYEFKNSCDACGKQKPRSKNRVGKEIGKELADKSKGLFAAEDWVCSKCGNVNWARRKTCNVCNAPKLADLEKRTGYGGGFNDRQDIEYIRRDTEDEFDEFGRKRKKKDNDQQSAAPVEQINEPKVIDETVDDEDEEEEEGEIDKYKLGSDAEEEVGWR
ncbi:Zn-finger in Ran binding protein [Cooperia oncophora]